MATHENSIVDLDANALKQDSANTTPSLAEITSNLSDGQGSKPEVVFVSETCDQNNGQEIVSPLLPTLPYANSAEAALGKPVAESSGVVSVDPFAQDVEGEIPPMPTLPVIHAQEMTDQVVARESDGDHHAWRLLSNQLSGVEDVTAGYFEPAVTETSLEQPENANNHSVLTDSRQLSYPTDRCGEGEDCFYAYPGDVISIDGNQGFDHIDLRSYSIEDATFQPGSIVLHTSIDPSQIAESECESVVEPITIKHRGVEFAIFAGDVRVDL